MHKLAQNLKSTVAMNQATLNNSSNSPSYVSMKNYDSAIFYIFTGTLAVGASLTCTIWQSDGSTPKTCGSSYSTTVTTSNSVTGLEIRGENLDNDNSYSQVGIKLTETGTQNAVVGVILIRERARYAQSSLPA